MSDALAVQIDVAAKHAAGFVEATLTCLALLAERRETTAPKVDTTSMSTSQIAEALNASAATMRRLAREPGAPVRFVGKAPRWDLARAKVWLDERGRKPAATSTERGDPEVDAIAKRGGLRLANGGHHGR